MSTRSSVLRLFTVTAMATLALAAAPVSGSADSAEPPSAGPTPPAAPAPLYSGPSITIASPVALCGVHEFDTLTISATVSVPGLFDTDDTDHFGTGPACPRGSEETLELRANTLVVTATGAVRADGITTDVPRFEPDGDENH